VEANAELEALAPLERGHFSVVALRVRIYAAAGRWQDALVIGRQFAETPVADAEMLLALSVCSSQLGDHDSARRWAGMAMEKDGSDAFKLRVLEDLMLTDIWTETSPEP
jgi:hypothetical protein